MLQHQFIEIDGVERIEKYVVGGFHPIKLGDQLNDGRYTIVHKLGHGGFSTTWLAWDKKEKRYGAIKVVMAAAPGFSREREIRLHLNHVVDSHLGGKYVQRLLDHFLENGPNGSHQCFVSVPGGCSVRESKDLCGGLWMFPLEVTRAIAAQMILGTAFLHAQGIAHGGMEVLLSAIQS